MEANGHQFGRFARSLAAACVRCAVTANEAPRVPLRWPFATTGCKSDRCIARGDTSLLDSGGMRWITALLASLALVVAGSSSTWSSERPDRHMPATVADASGFALIVDGATDALDLKDLWSREIHVEHVLRNDFGETSSAQMRYLVHDGGS